jgi:hypothetical protein
MQSITDLAPPVQIELPPCEEAPFEPSEEDWADYRRWSEDLELRRQADEVRAWYDAQAATGGFPGWLEANGGDADLEERFRQFAWDDQFSYAILDARDFPPTGLCPICQEIDFLDRATGRCPECSGRCVVCGVRGQTNEQAMCDRCDLAAVEGSRPTSPGASPGRCEGSTTRGMDAPLPFETSDVNRVTSECDSRERGVSLSDQQTNQHRPGSPVQVLEGGVEHVSGDG